MTRQHAVPPGTPKGELESVLDELIAVREGIVQSVSRHGAALDAIHPNYRDSARNLLHYLGLRRHDIRPLQLRLAALGLSSLGRSEAHVLATIDAILKLLCSLTNRPWPASRETALGFAEGRQLLARHTQALLGPSAPEREVRIMVTMPTEAAHDETLIRDLLQQGMDIMRINCAHDDPATWLRMVRHLRKAEKSIGRSSGILMDLAGPKLRTGPVEPGPGLVRVRPRRDYWGRLVAHGQVWLLPEASREPLPDTMRVWLRLPAEWLADLKVGERLEFNDARGARRILTVAEPTDHGIRAEIEETSYIVPGTVFSRSGDASRHGLRQARVGAMPAREQILTLNEGDELIVTRDLAPGRPATRDERGRILSPAVIGCTIPEALGDVRVGEAIWFDDGKIGGEIESVEADQIRVRITHTRPSGGKLRSDRGINLPDSNVRIAALTPDDTENLAFIVRHANAVGLSFANTVEDVAMLEEHLRRLGNRDLGIVLKIEKRLGFENLPAMLLAAMRWPVCGVMIARGDLAVECGFERLAEVQEEILWVSEAAHVPVIWATQVLENLAKQGMPSRAEISDAVMGHRAECVMLNKGPHITTAVRVLDDILRRMQTHEVKKSPMFRELRLAHLPSSEPDRSKDAPSA